MDIKEFFKLHKAVAVAFSGGVDSAVLLLLAKQYADRVKAYFVLSPFQPRFELEDARKIADMLNVRFESVSVDVLNDENIVKNPPNRCYYCKRHIFEAIAEKSEKDGFPLIIEGTNASDDISDRPGFRALKELGVLSPLREAGYTKKMIRQIASQNSLPVADKPSYACLATRIPSETKITKELLEKTEKAEDYLRQTGLRNFRVRYLDGSCKLELGKNEKELYKNNKNEIDTFLKNHYENIYLDSKERTDE
ncbi:MAG: ATP-dependent sacrificial sulfur transferase LarE [Ruminococcaceae bacterium]|jgi:uncharacterized protein|nr:ATP-dependent sacrificial sulfur transferase LarE [Oscillospiraceae bacterium]